MRIVDFFSFHLSKLTQPCNLESLLPSVKCELMRPDWFSPQLRVRRFRGLVDGAEGALYPCEWPFKLNTWNEGYLWRCLGSCRNRTIILEGTSHMLTPLLQGNQQSCGQTRTKRHPLSWPERVAALPQIRKRSRDVETLLQAVTPSNPLSFLTHLFLSFCNRVAASCQIGL